MPLAKREHFGSPSFSLSNRLRRACWNFFCALFFRLSPRPMHGWRSMLLRLWGAEIGRSCHIYPRAIIWAPWNLVCHDEAGIGDGANLYNQALITLGRRCVISQGAYLCTGSHDYTSPQFELYAKPITIGELAWIAAEAFVAPGITIGEGTVIGARSVVTKDMPPWMVCAGNPCQAIKPRVLKYDASGS